MAAITRTSTCSERAEPTRLKSPDCRTRSKRDWSSMGISPISSRKFLDEMAEMPMELQSRLLRVLQSGDFNRVGSARSEQVDRAP